MNDYRKQMRRSDGKFTRNTLTNCFMITKNDINEKAETFTCKKCGYRTKPVLKAWTCCKCGAENNEQRLAEFEHETKQNGGRER